MQEIVRLMQQEHNTQLHIQESQLQILVDKNEEQKRVCEDTRGNLGRER